jgi:hypothetical protein
MGQSVLLAGVAAPAGGDDVVPDVEATPAPGHHVIDALGRAAAVLTVVPVAGEDGPPIDRHRPIVGHPDIAGQTDDRRLGEGQPLRSEGPGRGVHVLRLGAQDEKKGPTGRDDPEGLEGGVQH